MSVERVTVTPKAEALLRKLQGQYGPLLFHQSGGCCDGSAPMCFPRGDFKIGQEDVFLGTIVDTPFYISGPQFEYWQHTHLTVDVVPGRGSGFSVEAPEGVRFLIRSRVFEDAEYRALQEAGPPPRGPQH
ncbi:DUF779 domain-containing protein [Hyalangium gracile]|uniref:DUF779 domain-containing protein n=1 Tax=Hyalangium gracile TaxID=394092 RepID=UPI001CCDA627|nr:DUF779 domain-containing protein [Hyalangium gracile]